MSESNPAFPPGTRMYYRSSDSEPWTELGGVSGMDPADGVDRSVITVASGTTTFTGKYDPAKMAEILKKLSVHGEPPTTTEDDNVNPLTRANNVKQKHYKNTAPTEAEKAISLLEGNPIPKAKPAVARHLAGRNDPCPCGSGRKYKRCHRLQT